MTRVVILGGGPAGLGAAYGLRKSGKAEVVLLERGDRVGGNAGSFVWNGHHLDFGSHRLHPASDPAILDEIKGLLGDELLDRPRHGRIRLMGRWLHFPLKPLDLAFHAPPRFLAGVTGDIFRKVLPKPQVAPENENFATVLDRGLGRAICQHFYFPYARKMWGLEPEEMSAIQAKKRVSAGSIGKLIGKVMKAVPGFKPPGAGRFYYPHKGFGQISDAYAEAAAKEGAEVRLGHTVTGLARDTGVGWRVEATDGSGKLSLAADHVWSTIPVTVVSRLLGDATPQDVRDAAGNVSYRSMVLIYLELDMPRFTEYDAHYYPGADIRITRMSEASNYGLNKHPDGRTVLCAELPCTKGDDVWTATDEQLAELFARDLATAGLPLPRKPIDVHVERLPQAYPIYPTGFETHLEKVQTFVDSQEEFLTFGRQGLFAHDNTHHALFMARAAVDCLGHDGTFDARKWARYRDEFTKHVVED